MPTNDGAIRSYLVTAEVRLRRRADETHSPSLAHPLASADRSSSSRLTEPFNV